MTKITIVRGDDRTLSLTFTDSDGVAINLTGSTIFFTVKERLTDADASAVISKTITSHTSPTLGKTNVVLTDSDTDIDAGIYYYDFQIKDSGGLISSTTPYILEILKDVTTRIVS